MTNVVSVKVSADMPPSKATWEVDVGAGTDVQQLAYVNLCYDLVAVALGKLGIEYSKWMTGVTSEEEFTKEMSKVRKFLVE